MTIYLWDLQVPQNGLSTIATLEAQYNSYGLCPYNDSGLADAKAVNLVLYEYNNTHTMEITIVDPELSGCNGRNDPALENCVRQRVYFIANQKGNTATYIVN